MAMSTFRVLFAGAVAVVLAAGCDIRVDDGRVSLGVTRGRASDNWTREYSISQGGRFELLNENGAIDVRGGSGSHVRVKAIREVSDSSDDAARTRLQTLKMREEVAPDRVLVQAETGDSSTFGRSRGVTVRYEVEVPAGLTVSLKTMNGGVRLDNVDGRITAATTNGAVSGSAVAGAVQASTVNGSVQMEVTALGGDMRLTTVNGTIRLELAPGIDADLDATTVNGGVSVDDRLGLTDVSSNRGGFGPTTSINGRLNKGGPKVTLQTTNGGVRVSPRGGGDEPRGGDADGRGRGRRGRGAFSF